MNGRDEKVIIKLCKLIQGIFTKNRKYTFFADKYLTFPIKFR